MLETNRKMCNVILCIRIYIYTEIFDCLAVRQGCILTEKQGSLFFCLSLYIFFIRLRMICSEDEDLDRRLEEYGKHLTVSGWKYKTAKETCGRGEQRQRKIPKPAHEKEGNENRVGEHLDPRVPSKTAIIKKNLHLLYANVLNKEIFPAGTIILSDRKRHITCSSRNTVYVVTCEVHDEWYVGSTTDLKARWRNHKIIRRKTEKSDKMWGG